MHDFKGKLRILIIEESATLRYMLGALLQQQNYELINVDDFKAAIDLLQTTSQQLHAIVVGWPDYDQFDEPARLLEILNTEPYSKAPVALLSSQYEPELYEWGHSRQTTSLILWENYLELRASLHKMIDMQLPEPAEEHNKHSRSRKAIRVLFVDDSRSSRKHYQRLLELRNYEVILASSVDEAYEIAQAHHIDIAIVDYYMPGQNGYVLCQKLRDNPQTAGIRTAVITSTYRTSVIRDCLKAGAVECFFKSEAAGLFLVRLASMCRFIRVQRSVERHRKHLSAILQSVGEGVYGVNNDGQITFMNLVALKLFGMQDVKPWLGVDASDAFHTDKHCANRDLLKEAYSSSKKLKGWETKFRRQDGKEIPVDCTLYPMFINGKKQGAVVAFRDISDRKMMEEKLYWQATHDHLTGLYNRRYIENCLQKEINDVKHKWLAGALVYLDLDQFKYINDAAGHEVGDRILVNLSHMIHKRLRRFDIPARIGGDEFAIFLKNVDERVAVKISDEIRQEISKLRVHHKDRVYHFTASFGVAMLDLENITAGDALENADIACHVAKRLGRNQVHLYEPGCEDHDNMGYELRWSERIKDALDNDKFQLHYQPVMRMQDIDINDLPAESGVLWQDYIKGDNKAYSFEVLVRMVDGDDAVHYPDNFIPIAERFNLMTDIDMWVLKHAMQDMLATGLPPDRLHLSINISGNTIDSNESLGKIRSLLDSYKVDPSALTFELSETSATDDIELTNNFISELRKLGCHVSLDNFGSGYCSVSQLNYLHTDAVKIDGQFVSIMARGATEKAIVTSVNDLSHSLDRYTVAECVEDPETVRLLKACGVDHVQGNYISAPLTGLPRSNSAKKMLQRRQPGKFS